MEMKAYLKILIVSAGVLLLQSSCSEDWLEPKPHSFYTPENVFVDKAGFEALLITMRKNLRTEYTGSMNFTVSEFAASDLAVPLTQLDFFNLTPNTSRYYKFLSLFTDAYVVIRNANVLISRIDQVEWEKEEDRNVLLAEAYWHRAYWYYRLVNTYGDVPFTGEEVLGAKLDYQTHSRWAILDKIQADLEFAVQWLPEQAAPNAISRGAGYHLLAKVCLANLEFDKAIQAATEVIDGPYRLMTQRFGAYADQGAYDLIWDLHRSENVNIPQNTETILAIVDRFDAPPVARSEGLYTMRHYHSAWHAATVLDSQGKRGTVASGPMYDSLGRGNSNVRPTPHFQYDLWNDGEHTWENTPDLRRSDGNWKDLDELFYNNPASVDYGKVIDPGNFAAATDTFFTLYAMPVYKTMVLEKDPQAPPYGGHGDWYVFRLADTYLLRAEAYYWKDRLSEAADDLNAVRGRAQALPVQAGEVTIDFILDERARELYAEEPRHSELVRVSYILAALNRNGYSLNNFSEKNYFYDRLMRVNILYEQKVFSNSGGTAAIAPFHVLWPVPASVITANTMGVINQNKGYDGDHRNVPPLETIEE